MLPKSIRRSMLATLTAFAALSCAIAAAPAQAQRVIRIVVPFGPGAVQDTIARTFSNEMGQLLGANIIVENRAGAGGTIGAAFVAKAAADGNTLILAGSSHHLAGHLYPKLTYDPFKDFVGVTALGGTGYVIAVPGNAGINSLADLVKQAKAKPGSFNYASAGNGSATHLSMASLNARAGLEMQHIAMKSTGDAVNEVLAGRVQAVSSATIGVIGFKGDGRMKFLAYTGAKRSPFVVDLPTVAESGYPGFAFEAWVGALAPAGTPRTEVDRLNAAIQKAMALPTVQERFTKLGIEYTAMTVDQYQAMLRADWEAAGTVIKMAGVKLDS